MEKKIATGKTMVLVSILCAATLMFGSIDFAKAALIDNGDGTVTDSDLGLMWLQQPYAPPNPDLTWDEAMAWAENLVFADYDDWRLPSALHFTTGVPDIAWNSINNEWGHLYGVEWDNPANELDEYPMIGYYPLWYWTSTADPGNPTQAFGFFLSWDGVWFNDVHSKGSQLHVTAVRDTAPVQVPPVASFTETLHHTLAGKPIFFDAGDSEDPDGTIVQYEWDFDTDGTYDAAGVTTQHAYPSPGTYTVTLRVTDNDGLQDTAAAEKTICDPAGELVVNGGFETGDLTGWTGSGAGVVSDGSPEGTYHAMLYSALSMITQSFSPAVSATSDLTCWASCTGYGPLRVTISYSDGTTDLWGQTVAGPWQQYIFPVDNTKQVSGITFQVYGEMLGDMGIDDVSLHVCTPPGPRIVFEEAHLARFTIGSNTAAEVTGGYAEFASYLTANGYAVSTIDPGTTIDSTVLASVDVLVVVAPVNTYSGSELDAIETWVNEGGRLLIISEWGIYAGEAATIAARFGFAQPDDAILDSDENTGYSSLPYFSGANLMVHPVTAGVARVEMYGCNGITDAPADAVPLIVTDSDGTATWFIAGGPALGVPVMCAIDQGTAGSGKLIVITDCNVWDSCYDADTDGHIDFYDSDHETLALNAIDWLAAAPSLDSYLVVRGQDNQIYYRIYDSASDSWGSWTSLPGATVDSPAAAVYENELHVVVRGADGSSLWHGYVDLATGGFVGWTWLSGSTPSAPSLTSDESKLCLVVRGSDNQIWCRSYTGSWGDWHNVPTGSTCDAPAAALLGGELHIVVRGMDEYSLWHIIVTSEGSVVRNWVAVSGSTSSKPDLTPQGLDTLHLVVRGMDNGIWCREYDESGDSWGAWSSKPGATCDGAGAAILDDVLHIVVRGMDGNSLWHWDGSSWTGISGSTPSAPTLTS